MNQGLPHWYPPPRFLRSGVTSSVPRRGSELLFKASHLERAEMLMVLGSLGHYFSMFFGRGRKSENMSLVLASFEGRRRLKNSVFMFFC